jgi:hypothetical protein
MLEAGLEEFFPHKCNAVMGPGYPGKHLLAIVLIINVAEIEKEN